MCHCVLILNQLIKVVVFEAFSYVMDNRVLPSRPSQGRIYVSNDGAAAFWEGVEGCNDD